MAEFTEEYKFLLKRYLVCNKQSQFRSKGSFNLNESFWIHNIISIDHACFFFIKIRETCFLFNFKSSLDSVFVVFFNTLLGRNRKKTKKSVVYFAPFVRNQESSKVIFTCNWWFRVLPQSAILKRGFFLEKNEKKWSFN